MRPRFVLASGNRHKLGEFAAILAPFEALPMPAGVTLPPEGEESFLANARAKAWALARALAAAPQGGAAASAYGPVDDLVFLADDSGLEVEALGWAPGVTSARYAGVDGPGADRANCEKLLGALAGVAGQRARRARFTCVLVAVTADGREFSATGHWWGHIATAPRGAGGFGYDPVFVPEGSTRTVAEWPQAAKDRESHRARAGRALLATLREGGVLDDGA